MHSVFQIVLFFPMVVLGYICKSIQMAFEFGTIIASREKDL